MAKMLNRGLILGALTGLLVACGGDECPDGSKEIGPGKCQWPGAATAGRGSMENGEDVDVGLGVGRPSAGRGGAGPIVAVAAGSGGRIATGGGGAGGAGGVGVGGRGGMGGIQSSTGADAGSDAVEPTEPTSKPVMPMTPPAPRCGDGHVDPGETCDGDCPDTCDDDNLCTDEEYTGRAAMCNVECKRTTLPDGARCGLTAQNTECMAGKCVPKCGNGKVDAGEMCDGASCPKTCDDGNPCTADVMQGSAAACSAVCVHKSATFASCPGGTCDENGQCQVKPVAMCGDGRVDTGEKCDGNCPTPASCDDGNPCTSDFVEGSGCSRQCAHDPFPAGWSGGGSCQCDGDGACREGGGTTGNDEGSWYGLCKSSADCDGTTCIEGLCTSDCSSDSNCGAAVSAGLKAHCLAGGQLCVQSGCTSDSQCPAGQFCAETTTVRACNPRPCGTGLPSCPGGFSCQSGQCK